MHIAKTNSPWANCRAYGISESTATGVLTGSMVRQARRSALGSRHGSIAVPVTLMGMDWSQDGGDWQRRIEELERQVAALQRKVFGHENVPPVPRSGEPDETWASAGVRRLAAGGNLVGAIKLLRSESGLSLKQAKDIVERL